LEMHRIVLVEASEQAEGMFTVNDIRKGLATNLNTTKELIDDNFMSIPNACRWNRST
jgi:hypothetical protein